MNLSEKVALSSMELSIRDIENTSGLDGVVSHFAANQNDFIKYFVLKSKQMTELNIESFWNAVTNTGNKAKIMYICEEVIADYFKIDRMDFYRRRALDFSRMDSKFSGTDAIVCLLYGVLFRVFAFSIPHLQENYNSNVKNYRDRWTETFDNVSLCKDRSTLSEKEQVVYDAMHSCMPEIKKRLIEAKVWAEAYNLYA